MKDKGAAGGASWRERGCTLVVAPLPIHRIAPPPDDVAVRVVDHEPVSGDARILVVTAAVPGMPSADDPSGPGPVTQERATGSPWWQVTLAVDEPPAGGERRRLWDTRGEGAVAWDAIRAIRSGTTPEDGAIGLAATILSPSGIASVRLDPGAMGAPIAAPCIAWSDGGVACVLATGLDGAEAYWDLVILRRSSNFGDWRVALRAMAYVPVRSAAESRADPVRSAAESRADGEASRASGDHAREAGADAAAGALDLAQLSSLDPADAPPPGPVAGLPSRRGGGWGHKQRVGASSGDVQAFRAGAIALGKRATRQVDALAIALQTGPVGGARLPWVLFWVGMGVYLVTRLWGVTEYPIAFDGDEAAIVVLGQALLENGFRDGQGTWFPIFLAYPNWNPDVSVYVHILASTLLGTSIAVTRGTSVLLTLPAPAALAASLRWGFGSRAWWTAPFVLSALPIWFHLSRTAYDTATWVTLLACAVAAYLRYRFHDPGWALQLTGALILTFYANSVAHLYAVGLALAILAIDWRYHLANWRAWRAPILLGLVGAVPFVAFVLKNPGYLAVRLDSTHPHWGDGSRALAEVLASIRRASGAALNPMAWFVSENRGRFVDVTGYHNYYPGTMPLLPWWIAPLLVAGVVAMLLPVAKGRRAILVALVALSLAPTAITRFAPTRSLAAVVPIILVSTYWMGQVGPSGRRASVMGAAGVIVVTTGSAFATLVEAMTVQTSRAQDYGAYGIQWGSKEVYGLLNRRLRANPDARVMVTTDWTWGAHHFLKFFVDRQDVAAGRVFLGSLETILKAREPWGPEVWAILSPAQLGVLEERVRDPASNGGLGPRVTAIEVVDRIAHPDGSPAFVMARLRESTDVARILAAERDAALRPTYSRMVIDGAPATVGTTAIDDGDVAPVLNGQPGSLVRFVGPNPTVIDVSYSVPRPISRVRMVLGSGMWSVTARLHDATTQAVVAAGGDGVTAGADSVVDFSVAGGPIIASRVVYEIRQPNATEDDSTVHLYVVEVTP